MKKQTNQSGFAHLGIVVVTLTVALIGTLGFVFYQNYIQKKTDNLGADVIELDDKKGNSTDSATKSDTQQYNNAEYGFYFMYPEGYEVKETQEGDSDRITVKDTKGVSILGISISPQQVPYGLENNYRVVTYSPTVDKSKKLILGERNYMKESTDTPNGGFYLFIDFDYNGNYYHAGTYNEDVNQSEYLDMSANQILSTWQFK